MTSRFRSRPIFRAWRVYPRCEGQRIERFARAGRTVECPKCGEILEAEPGSRLSPCLVLDATAYDLTCRVCRRFWCVVRHTPRSLRLIRMRRFVAALRETESSKPRGGAPFPPRIAGSAS